MSEGRTLRGHVLDTIAPFDHDDRADAAEYAHRAEVVPLTPAVVALLLAAHERRGLVRCPEGSEALAAAGTLFGRGILRLAYAVHRPAPVGRVVYYRLTPEGQLLAALLAAG